MPGGPAADDPLVDVSSVSGPGQSVQIALLAKVLDAARRQAAPAPDAGVAQSVTQAAAGRALLETVSALDVLA
jgi:hypothetical protein